MDECIFSTHNFSKQTSCSCYREHDLRYLKPLLEGIDQQIHMDTWLDELVCECQGKIRVIITVM